jgi:hypothetical protein
LRSRMVAQLFETLSMVRFFLDVNGLGGGELGAPEAVHVRTAFFANGVRGLLVPATRAAENQCGVTVSAEFDAVGIFVAAGVAVHSRNLLLAVTLQEKITDERHATVERQPQQAFQQAGAAFEALVNGVRFSFLGGDHCANIFKEIDAAFFTFAAGALVVAAGWTFVAQCCMALGTEAGDVARVGTAFWTFISGGRFLGSGWNRGPRNFRGRRDGWLGDSRSSFCGAGVLGG